MLWQFIYALLSQPLHYCAIAFVSFMRLPVWRRCAMTRVHWLVTTKVNPSVFRKAHNAWFTLRGCINYVRLWSVVFSLFFRCCLLFVSSLLLIVPCQFVCNLCHEKYYWSKTMFSFYILTRICVGLVCANNSNSAYNPIKFYYSWKGGLICHSHL